MTYVASSRLVRVALPLERGQAMPKNESMQSEAEAQSEGPLRPRSVVQGRAYASKDAARAEARG